MNLTKYLIVIVLVFFVEKMKKIIENNLVVTE